MKTPIETIAIKYDITDVLAVLTPPPAFDDKNIPVSILIDYFITWSIESFEAVGVFPTPVDTMGSAVTEWINANTKAYRLLWNKVKPPYRFSGHYALVHRIDNTLWLYYIINGEENL